MWYTKSDGLTGIDDFKYSNHLIGYIINSIRNRILFNVELLH